MFEVKRSIMIKCLPKEDINVLFDNYGIYVTKVLKHIESIYSQYEKIRAEGKCSICKQNKRLAYKHVQNPSKKICLNCFTRLWSEYTLHKNYKKKLVSLSKKLESFPILAVQQGYYLSVISTGIQIFKSYIKKKERRDEQILKAKDMCLEVQGDLDNLGYDIKQTKIKIRKGRHLTEELNKLLKKREKLKRDLRQWTKLSERKKIAFPNFRNNEIYLRKGMFIFKKKDDKHSLGISDYKQLKNRTWFDLKIGDYQKRFIDKCIALKQYRIVYPKLIRKRLLSAAQAKNQKRNAFDYYFILPSRDISDVRTSKKDVEDYVKKNKKSIALCCLSFGIKRPVTLAVINNNRVIDVKAFGDGSLFQKCELEAGLRSRIYGSISKRYKHANPHNSGENKLLHSKKRKALKKINAKLGSRNFRFVNYYNHNLTSQVIKYVKEKHKKAIIIFRETKGIKNINYHGILMRRLSKWSIRQQKTFLTYKSYLNEVPVYKIPYSQVNDVKCSKCGKQTSTKVLTEKLRFETVFECECGYKNDFLINDCINLGKQFIKKVL